MSPKCFSMNEVPVPVFPQQLYHKQPECNISDFPDLLQNQPPTAYVLTSLIIIYQYIHSANIHIITTPKQFVIYNVLHNMGRLLLSKVQSGISKPYIRKIVF